jgi:hypothetical protein
MQIAVQEKENNIQFGETDSSQEGRRGRSQTTIIIVIISSRRTKRRVSSETHKHTKNRLSFRVKIIIVINFVTAIFFSHTLCCCFGVDMT